MLLTLIPNEYNIVIFSKFIKTNRMSIYRRTPNKRFVRWNNNSGMLQEKNLIKSGQFYFIYDKDNENFELEDRTKRGLPIIEYSINFDTGFLAEIGRFFTAI